MGVYRYSARAAIKVVDGKQIGEFKYAYKPWQSFNPPAGFEAQCSRLDAMGGRAAEKLNARGVDLMCPAGFPSDKYPLSEVRRFPNGVPGGYFDGKDVGEPAGWMAKVGRRFQWFADKERAKAVLGDSLRNADLY